jgi:hypothetical protein
MNTVGQEVSSMGKNDVIDGLSGREGGNLGQAHEGSKKKPTRRVGDNKNDGVRVQTSRMLYP